MKFSCRVTCVCTVSKIKNIFLSSDYSPRSGRQRECIRSRDAVRSAAFCPAVRNNLCYAMWVQSTSRLPDMWVSFSIVVKCEIIDVIYNF